MPSPANAPPTRTELKNFLELAGRLGDAAARETLRYFRKRLDVENKLAGGFDPVTKADVQAEKAIRALLKAECPDHGVSGEEIANEPSDSRYTWVVDPIDGTRAFISGLPLWGTLIGLLDGATPIVGLMDQPFTGERFLAARGQGAFLEHRGARSRLKTRKTTSLGGATLLSTTPDMFQTRGEKAAFARMVEAVKMRRFGGDCYAYAMLAAGHADVVVEAALKSVDIVALIPIIEEAGGVVTTWDGASAIHGGRIVAAATPELHQAACAALQA